MRGRRTKLLVGAVVIAGALGYLIYSGMSSAVVYFVTPTELRAQAATVGDRALRLGGMVERGSVAWDPRTLALRFRITDGATSISVAHTGSPPDLFAEGTGAVVEGRLAPDGTFAASTIMAKHSEEYVPPRAGEMPVFQKGRYRPAGANAAAAPAEPAGGRAAAGSGPPAAPDGAAGSAGGAY